MISEFKRLGFTTFNPVSCEIAKKIARFETFLPTERMRRCLSNNLDALLNFWQAATNSNRVMSVDGRVVDDAFCFHGMVVLAALAYSP